jgi:flotillin
LGILLIVILLIGGLSFAAYSMSFKKVAENSALFRISLDKQEVFLSGKHHFKPYKHKMQEVSLLPFSFIIDELQKTQGLITKDHFRVDLVLQVSLKLKAEEKSLLKAIQNIHINKATDPNYVKAFLIEDFLEVLKWLGTTYSFKALKTQSEDFLQALKKEMTPKTRFYELVDLQVQMLEPTPIKYLNPNNVVDAKAIENLEKWKEGKNE